MDLSFKSKKLAKVLHEEALLRKTYGVANAARIRVRLAVLAAAATLAEVPAARPERCHRLLGQREGCFAVDILQPYRLVFEPDYELLGAPSAGRFNAAKVTAIVILEIVDYH